MRRNDLDEREETAGCGRNARPRCKQKREHEMTKLTTAWI